MKTGLLLGIFLGVVLGLTQISEAHVTAEWIASYNGPGNGDDDGYSLALDDSGNIYVTGHSVGSTTQLDVVTIKYNSAGVQQWVARYNGPANGEDEAYNLVLDGQNNVYVAGRSYGGAATDYDFLTIKYNSNGQQQWAARYNGTGSGVDEAFGLGVDGNGNIYVTGPSVGPAYWMIASDCATIKYDSTGRQLWVARYDAGNLDWSNSLAVDENGNVVITGTSLGSGTFLDYITIKYNTNGDQLWLARYNGPPGDNDDEAYSIAMDENGYIYVTGYSYDDGPSDDYLTIKYDGNGIEQWTARYTGGYGTRDYAYCVTVDGDDNVYVTGTAVIAGTLEDYLTIKYNAAGQQQWTARYNGTGSGVDKAYKLVVDMNGNVYVTGYSLGYWTDWDCATVKYDSLGVEQWVARYSTPGYDTDWGSGITLDGNNNVYVVGGDAAGNCITIKYSQPLLPLEVTIQPLYLPVIIPANGGAFQFTASLANYSSTQTPFSIWTRVKNPNGTYTGPTLGPVLINPPLGQIVTRIRTQNVPGTWPAGNYLYLSYVNWSYNYPAVDSNSFQFVKAATADNGTFVWEATCTGPDFPYMVGTADPTPGRLALSNIFPNPFNTSTVISYQLPESGSALLTVHDVQGRLVATLVNGRQSAGEHSAIFDGATLASGIYLAKLTAGEYTATQKLVLLK